MVHGPHSYGAFFLFTELKYNMPRNFLKVCTVCVHEEAMRQQQIIGTLTNEGDPKSWYFNNRY